MQVLRTNIKCTVYSLIQYENTDKKKHKNNEWIKTINFKTRVIEANVLLFYTRDNWSSRSAVHVIIIHTYTVAFLFCRSKRNPNLKNFGAISIPFWKREIYLGTPNTRYVGVTNSWSTDIAHDKPTKIRE